MLRLKSKFKNVDVLSLKLDCGAVGDTNDQEDEKKDDVLVDNSEGEGEKEEI